MEKDKGFKYVDKKIIDGFTEPTLQNFEEVNKVKQTILLWNWYCI